MRYPSSTRAWRPAAAAAWGCAVVGALLAVACAGRPWRGFDEPGGPMWPPPPESPRVAFLREIRSQRDLFRTGGLWPAVRDFFVGAPDTTLVRPFALALTPDGGGLLVADPGRRLVHYFDWSRGRYVAIGDRLEGGLPSPVGVTALPDGRILVSDSRRGVIESFEADGRPLGPFGAPGELGRPAGLACDAARGRVYAVDVTGHCVAVLDLQGRRMGTIGRHGAGPGEFNFPTFLALDAAGRLIVTDALNARLQVLTPEGAFVRAVGEPGDGPGRFAKPKGVAVDAAGRLIAVEGLHDAVQFFDAQGRLLLSLGAPGSGPGEFWLPAGLALDAARHLLFVADSYNGRVQVFRLLESADPEA